uniref:LRR receptor-like serine/threonine-protein kinase FLS2 n=1 Tax=Aegilops tauschii TaxID=37682 RepID=R7VZM6_AEGTA
MKGRNGECRAMGDEEAGGGGRDDNAGRMEEPVAGDEEGARHEDRVGPSSECPETPQERQRRPPPALIPEPVRQGERPGLAVLARRGNRETGPRPSSAFLGTLYVVLASLEPDIMVTDGSLTLMPCVIASNGSCVAYERDALLSVKESLWEPSVNLSSWQGEECCNWKGVRCSYKTGHVVKLNLRGSAQDCLRYSAYRGAISHSLVTLQQLRYLDLSCNSFNWSEIPEFIGSFPSLRYLNLSYSLFYGRVRPHIGNLSKLAYLDLKLPSYNILYSSDLRWLSHLSSLKHLDLSYINLTTAVDWVHQINILPNLRKLYLQHTGLRSTPPFLDQSNLTALEVLDISWNNFNTTIAPNWFWNTTSLTSLNLQACRFYGPIPEHIGSMASLEAIYFSGNDLMSTMIPSNFKNLCNLKILDLSGSDISGDITELMERLPNCPSNKMQVLDLTDSMVSGPMPNMAGPLTNLTCLALSQNKLTGPIPQWIWSLTELLILDLDGTELNGVVTEDHLKRLTNLKILGLGKTLLEIKVSPDWVPPFKLRAVVLQGLQLGPAFPSWLRSQTSHETLMIANASITTIPDWFWVAFSRAKIVDLSYNQITGTLPATLEFMAAEVMALCSNRFTGTIPKFPRNTKIMYLSVNSLSGTLPSDFGAPLLQVISLYNNSISGPIPSSLCSLSQLAFVDLSGNKLTGEVPSCEEDSNPPMHNLNVVNLNTNNLSGEFPRVFQTCPNLVFVDLSYNKFSGDLPLWIGVKLPYLALLRLRYNMFSGQIPTEIGKFQELQFLDLAHNNFSGSMPNSLVNLSAMARTSGYSNVLGQQLDFSPEILYMSILDLSCNNLTGAIPQDIGALIGLRSLNFSWNNLSGAIPEKICELEQLESLDLSNNELSHEIPSSMTALTSLSHMNLSYNSLSGMIPTGNQFHTYDASVYIGNTGLCGYPLTNICPGNSSSRPTHAGHGDGSEDISLYLGLAVGYILGLWVVFCVMLFKKS